MGDTSPKVKREDSGSQQHPTRTREKPLGIGEDREDGDDQSVESFSNQLVLYNPNKSNTNEDVLETSTQIDVQSSSVRSSLTRNPPRPLMPIGSFTVQCATCFKWRLIPTQTKYEEIRERILQDPFVCDRAREWRPDITCDDPADISQDGSRIWAIDKPNIAQPPTGWERLLRIRGEGSTKFADVYYVAPSGKRLRSTVEVEKYAQNFQQYLFEHPEYIRQGVTLSQFSFQTPRPLQENYIRKRPARLTNAYAGAGLDSPLEPVDVNPLSWVEPPTRQDLQIGGSSLSTRYFKPPLYDSPVETPPPAKKTKKATRPSSKQMYSSSVYNEPNNNIDTQQERHASPYEL